MSIQSRLESTLARRLGGSWSAYSIGASTFCETWRAEGSTHPLFVKSVPLRSSHVLEAEADGLATLAESRAIRTPRVVDCWRDEESGMTLLAMEWLEFDNADPTFGERLGRDLALLHQTVPAVSEGRFGWSRGNMIGGTLQSNDWSESRGVEGWLQFLRRERLGAMRTRAVGSGVSSQLVDALHLLEDSLPSFFADGYEPRPSLIHGDLWSGNWGMLGDGTAVIYDPAISCSDVEAELAMMELFGGVPRGFWPAYERIQPLSPGYAHRRGLYQLYHLANHAVLFGGGYVQQALTLARRLAASL